MMQINVSHQPPDCLHLRTRQPESERRTPPAGVWVALVSDIVGGDAAEFEAGLPLSNSTQPAA
jgi:hypothetical protein